VVKQKYTAKTSSNANLNSKNNTVKKLKNNGELDDREIGLLRALVNENNSIDPAEVKDRLRKDINLIVSISTVRESLKKLKKEMILNNTSLDTCEQNLITKGAHTNQPNRLNYLHIEILKRYLDENSSIDNIEARNKLQEDTGLDVRIQNVRACLSKLKKEAEVKPKGICLTIAKSKQQSYGYVIKDAEIDRLKIYLKEDRFIQAIEAKYRLQKETGLEVSIHSIGKALTRLRRELNSENSSSALSKNKYRTPVYNLKLKNMHIEFLKKYLKEDIFIGPSNASYKLHEETGLRVSVYTVRRALKKLKEEIYPEHDIPTSSTPHSRAKKPKPKPSYIGLSNTHIKRLKNYLKEDNSIESVEARNRLQEETGLDLDINSIYKNLKRIKKEMGLECTKRSILSSIFDIIKSYERL
jgi:Fe2+ or Zn2+ uptake regulation protein